MVQVKMAELLKTWGERPQGSLGRKGIGQWADSAGGT